MNRFSTVDTITVHSLCRLSAKAKNWHISEIFNLRSGFSSCTGVRQSTPWPPTPTPQKKRCTKIKSLHFFFFFYKNRLVTVPVGTRRGRRGRGGRGGGEGAGVIVVGVCEPLFQNLSHSYTWPLKKWTHSDTGAYEILTHHCSLIFCIHLLLVVRRISITKTYLYNFDPLKPHFYIVKLGFTGVYIIFLISAQKRRLSVLVRTVSPRRF